MCPDMLAVVLLWLRVTKVTPHLRDDVWNSQAVVRTASLGGMFPLIASVGQRLLLPGLIGTSRSCIKFDSKTSETEDDVPPPEVLPERLQNRAQLMPNLRAE